MRTRVLFGLFLSLLFISNSIFAQTTTGTVKFFVSETPFESFSEFKIGSNSAVVSVNINIKEASSEGTMLHDLNDSKELPLVQPYNISPFNYETFDEIVDLDFWITT